MSQNIFTDAVVALLSCLEGDYTDGNTGPYLERP